MVHILDGNSEHVAHARRKKGLLGEKKNPILTALDLFNCLEQIK